MSRLLIFLCIYICVQTLHAQDSTANKKPKESSAVEAAKPDAPKTETPKTEPPKGDAAVNNPMNPPTFSGQPQTPASQPYIVISKEEYEKEYRPERIIREIMPGSRRDTLPPKYIADASYLPIVTWETPAVGTAPTETDSNMSVVKPTILTSQRSDVLVELSTWKQESKIFSIPVKFKDKKEVHLSRYFNLPTSPKNYKKLYLYFEGIAWRSEVKLNGKFLGINENPFQAWAIPIDAAWLREEDNYLEVSLSTNAKQTPFFPTPFLGVFRAAYIIDEAQLAQIRKPILTEVPKTKEKVAIYAPYFYEHDYEFDKFSAVNVLLHAKRAGISYIHFLFPPDKELQRLCQEMEFISVKKLEKGQPVAWLNKYPYQAENFPFTEQFWLDEKGLRTINYQLVAPYDTALVFAAKKEVSPFFAFWVLFPLLGMFFIKILNAKFFTSFLDVLISPRLAIDKFMESTSGNRGLLIILQVIRVMIVAVCLALLADYVQSNNQWHILRTLGGNGIIFNFFGVKMPFWANILKSFAIVSIWAMVRMFLIRSLSGLFRIHNMYEGLTNLELIGAYPLVFLLPLPLTMLSFAGYEWHSTLLWLQALLMIAYLTRQVYLCYIGMGRLFRFSFSVKWLYILGGIILPYLICL